MSGVTVGVYKWNEIKFYAKQQFFIISSFYSMVYV
jgi:hypothetical protein